MRTPLLFTLAFLVVALFRIAAHAQPEVYDAEEEGTLFITDGFDILCLDYLEVFDNGVQEDGTDFPYGRLWLIMYDPRPYEDQSEMNEDEWDRRDELERFELPGPSSQGRWGNDDSVAFRSAGIYGWDENRWDRVVFRLVVEEPTEAWETDTLMWGTIHEDDSYNTEVFEDEQINVFFRTTDLPEERLFPDAEITEIWFEHNVMSGGREGLEVHVVFDIDHMRTYTGRLCVFVHYEVDGEQVICAGDDPAYESPNGYLTIQEDFVPLYPTTTFTDFPLFIPYDAFPESDRYIDYYIDIEILDELWELIGTGTSPVFELRRSGKSIR